MRSSRLGEAPAFPADDAIDPMTLARPPDRTTRPTVGAAETSVTAILVVHDGGRWLVECLDALAAQNRPPDRLFIVDTGSVDGSAAIVAGHDRIRRCIPDVRTLSAPRDTLFGAAVSLAVSGLSQPTAGDWLWLLHDDSAATPSTLAQLLDAVRRSSSVGIAGPKLTSWEDPTRLLEVGLQVTRSGRRAGGPGDGEPDQGQHDHRCDVLGVSTSGMLVRREVFEAIGGFDPAFGRFGDDLDLSWRAHLAGHRVVVVPRARLREAAASARGQRGADLSAAAARRMGRRHGRQVALTRCSWPAAPFLALWIALTSLGSSLALLLVKRPGRAWTELTDLGALLTPWRVVAARWRSRGQGRIRRRDLHGLFVPPRVALRHTLEGIQDAAALGRAERLEETPGRGEPVETGPVSDEAQQLDVAPVTWTQQVLRHPGLLAVLGTAVLAVVAWRSLLRDGALGAAARGLSGGELLTVVTDASGLWHAYLDGWHGSGLGSAAASAPYLPALAGGAWLVEHMPLTDSAHSPAAVALAWLFLLAMPLSACSAYVAGRVATTSRWPRAWAALAWASLATLTTALGSGRLGAVAAHVLLPLVVAGFAAVARRSAGVAVTAATALALAVMGAFNPLLLAVGLIAAVVLLVVGRGTTRLRAVALLLAPLGLVGPWVTEIRHDPVLLLSGPGLGVWSGAGAQPWQLALLHPGGPGSYPSLLSAPILLAGAAGLLRPGVRSRARTALAVLALAGLAFGLLAPRLVVGRIPPGMERAGDPITVWPGTGLDLFAVALIAAAVLGLRGLSVRLDGIGFGRRQVRVVPVLAVAVVAVVGVLGSAVQAGWHGLGRTVTAAVRTTPAVASEQARGAPANRLLVLQPEGGTVGYRVVGAEPGPVARDLPGRPRTPPDSLLASSVAAVLADSAAVDANRASAGLASHAIGFVGYRGGATDPLVRRLDSTAGLTRLSDSFGLVLWRVLPVAAATRPHTPVAPARLRLENGTGAPTGTVETQGAHARTATDLPAAPGDRRLVVAEPPGWTDHARITFAGRDVRPVAGAAQPTYSLPREAGRLVVEVLPAQPGWRWAQLGLLVILLFLAAPFGGRRPRTSR